VGLIPTTLAETGLGTKTTGSRVNLEVDVLAKYTERLLAFRTVTGGAGGTETGGTVAPAPGGAL
jgi:riboflavin synthase